MTADEPIKPSRRVGPAVASSPPALPPNYAHGRHQSASDAPNKRQPHSIALFRELGPGLVTGAADDDPSGVATYSQAGAQFGFGLLWTMVLIFPLMSAIQLTSARIGRVTGRGLAGNMTTLLWRPLVMMLVGLLFVANTINIGADLAAMGAAAQLVVGGNAHTYTVLFALVILGLQLSLPYRRYAVFLKWLTLSLLSYVALLFLVKLDWGEVARGLVVPNISGKGAVVTLVAIFGTSISPYLFFWQSAQESEEVEQDSNAEALIDAPRQASRELRRMRFDTFAGMAVATLVAIAIMAGTAVTLHQAGKTDIATAADAAAALRPVAGRFAFLLFSLGIIGTGLLAVPVLAGSAAYAIGEARGWRCGLDERPHQAIGFYAVIILSTLLGIGIVWSPLDPIKSLFWSAVINGVVAVPIMATMMVIASRPSLMGGFVAPWPQRALGWLATAILGSAAIAMVVVQ